MFVRSIPGASWECNLASSLSETIVFCFYDHKISSNCSASTLAFGTSDCVMNTVDNGNRDTHPSRYSSTRLDLTAFRNSRIFDALCASSVQMPPCSDQLTTMSSCASSANVVNSVASTAPPSE